MTQKQKDLLIKDICSRLPYGVKVSDNEGDIINVVGIHKDAIIVPYAGITKTIQIDSCKPYLLPISSMTEKQKEEYAHILVMGSIIACSQLIGETAQDWLNKNYFWYKTDKHAVFRYIEIDGHEYVEYRSGGIQGGSSSLCHSPKCHCLK